MREQYTQEQDEEISDALEAERRRLVAEYSISLDEFDQAYRRNWLNWLTPVQIGGTATVVVWAATALNPALGLMLAVIAAGFLAWAFMQ